MALKNGLFYENDELIYYKDGAPKHAGVVKVGKDIYYISSGGKAIKGQHIVHGEMSNGILKRGTYTFGEDYKLVAGSYIAPRKTRPKRKAIISRRMRRSFSIRDSLKRMKHKKLMLTTLIAAMLFAVAVFVVEAGKHSNPVTSNPGVYEGTNIKVTLPEYTEDMLLCSKAAKLEYDGELALKTAVEAGNPYRPFVFEYSLIKEPLI